MDNTTIGVCPVTSTGVAPLIFTTAFGYFAASQCLITDNWPPDATVTDNEQFDFIIVGAGSAGSVVANRLSEVKDWKILLIEAGGNPPEESIIPYLSTTMYYTQYDWSYQTVNDGRIDQGLNNGSVPWPRGKMLGGSSSINAMIYYRGNDNDYQAWYNDGNKEWHPSIVRKYFEKLENLQDQHLLKIPKIREFYGEHGPLIVNSFNDTMEPVLRRVLKSYDDIGIKNVPDLNVANVFGSSFFRGTASNGERNSAATAYLNPIQHRNNLKILKQSVVTKILIDPNTKIAQGVEIDRNGRRMLLFATKEVILSAGSINTPQLLMLSGIGPKEHLESLNITCYVDSPLVGKNLQDHTVLPVTIYGNENHLPSVADMQFDAIKYLYNRRGYLSQTFANNINAFYSIDWHATYPLFQNHARVFRKGDVLEVQHFFSYVSNYQQSVVDSIIELNAEHALFFIELQLLHPFSRGYILLRSNDYKDKPLIYSNTFRDLKDLKLAVEGIKILTQIVHTDYFKSIDGFIGRMKFPPCDKFILGSDEYWECICFNFVTTIFHPVGTAKMGYDIKQSVVNGRLKVHGVKKLRIIDASIMPTTISANTNGPSIMIGERASDLIKEDHKQHKYFMNYDLVDSVGSSFKGLKDDTSFPTYMNYDE